MLDLGSGTLSGPRREQRGCLRGGDEVVFTASGGGVELGEVRGTVLDQNSAA